MFHVVMEVTPQIAAEWLKTDVRNRELNKREIKKIEYDLMHGEFYLTHQSVAIDPFGNLFDGNHRLTAIVNTGISAVLDVAFNAPRNPKVDAGMKRNAKQSLYMAGVIEKDSLEYNTLTFPLIKFMVASSISAERATTLTENNLHSLYLRFKNIIDPVVVIARRASGKCRSAAILYAMACALASGVDENVIKRWHHIVETGEYYVPGDDQLSQAGTSVLLFKKYNQEKATASATHSKKEDINTIVEKAMSSISSYEKKREIKKLYGHRDYEYITVTEEDICYKEEKTA